MNSAKERAVEAAREAGRQLAGGLPGALQEAFGDVAVAGIRAAFPILAEELVAWHDEAAEALEAKRQGKYRILPAFLEKQLAFHRQSARALRARIQQMAEGL